MNATMEYDKTIKTETTTHRVTTVHLDQIDWDGYDFNDPKHTRCICLDEAGKANEVRKHIEYLRTCERVREGGDEVFASNYGGWPRIWHRVIRVAMVSAWPYWECRPCVLVESTLGCEWYDWMSLTGAEVRPA